MSTQITATNFDFDQIKSIPEGTQYSVYDFIWRCQSLLPANNTYYIIPELIECTILLFYNKPQLFAVNDSKLFTYKNYQHGDYFKLYGTNISFIVNTQKNINGFLKQVIDFQVVLELSMRQILYQHLMKFKMENVIGSIKM